MTVPDDITPVPHRRLILATTLALAALVVAVCFKSRDRATTSVPVRIHDHQSLTVAGEQRQYLLIVPQSPPGDRIPLLIAFHGMGESAAAMVDYTRLDQFAAEHSVLIAVPETSHGAWIMQAPGALSEHYPDLLLFDALLNRLEQQHPVDGHRVYLLGMSNGASFAQLLMRFRSTQIAAVVAHSGPPPRELVDLVAERKCPIMLLVGRNDSRFVVDDAAEAARTYRASGHTVEFITIHGLGHAWSRDNDAAVWRFLSQTPDPDQAPRPPQ